MYSQLKRLHLRTFHYYRICRGIGAPCFKTFASQSYNCKIWFTILKSSLVLQEWVILIHLWLLVLTLATLVVAVACLKYCATNRDARLVLRYQQGF